MRVLKDALEFEWDDGNRGKNSQKHGITDSESEESFFDSEKKVLKDTRHSKQENRYILIGQTRQQKTLFVVFTKRKDKIRIISSRVLNKKERHLYEEI